MKFGSLEALRGIAALGVVLFHSPFVVESRGWALENASLFVDFFFILSGFVMAHAYRARITAGMSLREFAILRLGRIYPVHVLMIVVWAGYVVFSGLGDPAAWGITLKHLQGVLPNLLMVNSIGLQPHLSLNYPAWSVGAEFLVYIVFFAAVARLQNLLTGRVALVISAAAYLLIACVSEATLQRTYDLGMVRCVGGFFVGFAMHTFYSEWAFGRLRTGSEVAVSTAAIALLAMPSGSMLTEIFTIAAFAAVVLVFAQSEGVLSRALCSQFPAYLGRVSYSIYMLHAIVLTIAFDIVLRMDVLPSVWIASPVHGWEIFLLTPYALAINAVLVLVVIQLSRLCYQNVEEPCRLAARRWAAKSNARARVTHGATS